MEKQIKCSNYGKEKLKMKDFFFISAILKIWKGCVNKCMV